MINITLGNRRCAGQSAWRGGLCTLQLNLGAECRLLACIFAYRLDKEPHSHFICVFSRVSRGTPASLRPMAAPPPA